MQEAIIYGNKTTRYFSGARKPFIDDLPENKSGRLLEIGCGNGDTAAYAKTTGKCGWACGIELCAAPGEEARTKLDRVIVGNVETATLDFPANYFDVLIMSEVLEHLVDPWAVLRKLRKIMKPNGLVRSGSPNVCHYSVVSTLFSGLWRYEKEGIFDATHLRWFSPSTYKNMFDECGFATDWVGPAGPLHPKGKIANALTLGRLRHLFHTQIYLKAHCV